MMSQVKFQFLVGSILLLTVTRFVQAEGTEDPGYDCYPNGTITIANPNATLFTRVIATYNDGTNVHMCSVSGTTLISITNCNLTFPVTVVFSEYSPDNITTGNNIQACQLECTQMTMHTIGFNGSFGVSIPVTIKPVVTPTYSISAGFFGQNAGGPGNGTPVFEAEIGDTIDFTMTGPVDYFLKPLVCIAYDNPSKAMSTSNKTLIVDGCTTDDKLMSDFNRTEDSTDFRYTATFCVFKFYQSNDLYIECTVKVCPSADSCAIVCMGGSRKRRDVMDPYEGLEEDESRLAMIGRRLRVLENPIGRSSQMHGSIVLCALMSFFMFW